MMLRKGLIIFLLSACMLIAFGVTTGTAQEQADELSLRDNAIIDGVEG